MRSSRVSKFRKKHRKVVILAQILAIWYATVLSTAVLTSDTFAYFSDSIRTNISIHSGTWWDGSDLEFIVKNTENVKACAPYDIEIDVLNKGYGMIEATEYEVYFIDNGNPKNGTLVAQGLINVIGKGETATLTYAAEENGSYMFKAYQRPGYSDNYEQRSDFWSKKYMIQCIVPDAEEDSKDISDDVENIEVKEEESEELSEITEKAKKDEKSKEKESESIPKEEVEKEKKEKIIDENIKHNEEKSQPSEPTDHGKKEEIKPQDSPNEEETNETE